jgi:hypothetical protein
MGKQFAVITTPSDLKDLQKVLASQSETTFWYQWRTDTSLGGLKTLEDLAVELPDALKNTVWCYLAPAYEHPPLIFQQYGQNKLTLDLEQSNVIELWRTYFDVDSGHVSSARMFFQNKLFFNNQWFEKDPKFCIWADQIFKVVKKSLIKKSFNGNVYYCGKESAQLLETGAMKLA